MNFFVVATPIGNLDDITLRALETLKRADIVLCEDTRVTQKLLNHFKINAKTASFHQHSKLSKIKSIKDMLRQGKEVALVTDAGTPGISDPGGKLVEALVNEFGSEITIIPVPGPSAVTAILSVSGLPADKFVFMGFPPHKKGRQKFWQELAEQKNTAVFYESTHRIIKSLEELSAVLGNRKIIVGRELTKKFETIYRGTAARVMSEIKQSSSKGEFVVAVEGRSKKLR